MNQLEIIHLRMAGRSPDRMLEQLRRSLYTRVGTRVRIYRQARVSGDIGVHLHLLPGEGAGEPSDLGLHLAAALREHGMVEHTVWIEDQDASGVTE